MKKITCSLFIAIALLFGNASAQTVHVINYCNTLDKDIGADVDYQRTVQEASYVASFLNYDIQFYTGEGEDCSNENLNAVLNSLQCGPEDVVIFYYSGHGSRFPQDKGEWPQLCLKYNGYQSGKWISMESVMEKLKTKGAYFTLVMADCCNAGGVSSDKSLLSKVSKPAVDNEVVRRNYKKLFLGTKGMVAVTSSKKGQTSAGGPTHGGLFSYMFFETALYSACIGETPATWESILSNVKRLTEKKQEPHYEIIPYSTPSQPNQTVVAPPSQPQQTVMAVDNGLSKALSVMLDGSRSMEWRTRQADLVADKYFSQDAIVLTVGRNGTTVVENETARDFLKRLAVSSLIKQIIVVSDKTDANGKRNYLKVQEVRKEK